MSRPILGDPGTVGTSTTLDDPGFREGLMVGLARVATPRALGTALVTLATMALVAFVERRDEHAGAASRALQGGAFGVVLPLALLGASTRVLAGTRLDLATSPFARFGTSRRAVALGFIAASMIGGALLASLGGALTVIIARDPSAPPAAIDAFTCAWIGALTAACYAAMFALGSTFGARGGGRFWALTLNFVLAGTGSFSALLVPQAHAQNLLGGEPPMMLAQPLSTLALAVLTIAFTGLALARTQP